MDLTDDFCPLRCDTAAELHVAFGLLVVSRSYGQLGSLHLMSTLARTQKRLMY